MAKKGKRAGRGRNPVHGTKQRPRVDYADTPKTNALFEKYYSQLGILEEGELQELWTALRRDLPNSFRFTGSKGHALPVQQRLIDYYIPQITSITHEGQQVTPPEPLSWFPNQLAWQMTTPKNVVRKFAPFSAFQKFLVSETSVGNISRQEIVSMIPPLVLDVKPGMTVLDLCAAPGSKTAQLIEMVHGGEEARMRKVARDYKRSEGRSISPDGDGIQQEMEEEEQHGDWSDDGRSTGLVVANDVDYKRAHMLIHQTKRLNSPNLIVTNHDATFYPSIKLPTLPAAKGEKQPPGRYLKFDRILADVPCSGDGTARKNYNVWKEWKPANGVGLHVTQERILVRSLQMLKTGGRVVYSTCSMNPIENEAVIAAAIDRCGGTSKVEVVDSTTLIPGLKRKPGLKSWKVMDKSGELWESWEEVKEHINNYGIDNMGKIVPSMFPPTGKSDGPQLERCMRVYAHQQDTGSFFIAVLEKKAEIRARPEGEPKVQPKEEEAPVPPISAAITELESKTNGNDPTERIEALDALQQPTINHEDNASAAARLDGANSDSAALPPKREAVEDDHADNAAKRLKAEDGTSQKAENSTLANPPSLPAPQRKHNRTPQFEEAFKYLDPSHEVLDAIYSFYQINPRFPRDRFLVRNETGHPAKTIYYSSALAKDILTENEGRGVKFVHCGIKMFVRQDVQSPEVCPWRIQTEGMPILESWVGDDRVIRLNSRKTFRKLLLEMFPKVSAGGWMELGEIGEVARNLSMGCCVLRIEKGEGEDAFSERMVLPIWRSAHSLNLMLPKEDRKAMLLRLYNDESPLQDHHQRQRQQKQQEELGKADNSSSDREVVAAGGHGGIGDIDDMLDAAMDAEAKPATIEDDEDGTAAVSPPPVKDRLALADEDEEILVADGGAAVEETVPGNAELEVEAEKDQDEKME